MNKIISVFIELPQAHVFATSLTLGIVSLLLYAQYFKKWSFEKVSPYPFLFLPLIIEIIYQVSILVDGAWSYKTSLPLEFSYITSLSAVTYLFCNHNKINRWFYFAGIWSATAAFINTIMFGTEAWYIFLRYYGHHGILLFFAIFPL